MKLLERFQMVTIGVPGLGCIEGRWDSDCLIHQNLCFRSSNIRVQTLPKADPTNLRPPIFFFWGGGGYWALDISRSSFANDCEKGSNNFIKGPKGRNDHTEPVNLKHFSTLCSPDSFRHNFKTLF